jgi:hypothetical protein
MIFGDTNIVPENGGCEYDMKAVAIIMKNEAKADLLILELNISTRKKCIEEFFIA